MLAISLYTWTIWTFSCPSKLLNNNAISYHQFFKADFFLLRSSTLFFSASIPHQNRWLSGENFWRNDSSRRLQGKTSFGISKLMFKNQSRAIGQEHWASNGSITKRPEYANKGHAFPTNGPTAWLAFRVAHSMTTILVSIGELGYRD